MAHDAVEEGSAGVPALQAAARRAREANDFVTAERLIRQALRGAPADAGLWSDHADMLDELHRVAEAAAAYQRALELDSANPARRNDYAMNRLKLGFLREGFEAYEARIPLLAAAGGLISQFAAYPRWDGVARERVMLCGEQGLGDQIMFARFIPRVAARARTVQVAVRPPLVELFARHYDVLRPSAAGGSTATLPAFDSWVPMGSLPWLLGCRTDDDVRAPGYLAADPARVATWAPAIDRHGLAVGLVWRGNRDFPRNARRSLSAALYQPLAAVPGVAYYALQLPTDPETLPWMADLSPRIADFDDTAAILQQLDLLITSDTAIAHLAGALGRPVWLLLSRVADWRWQLEGSESAWYPSMRLFRQPALGDWAAVVGAVEQALRARVAETRRGGAMAPR